MISEGASICGNCARRVQGYPESPCGSGMAAAGAPWPAIAAMAAPQQAPKPGTRCAAVILAPGCGPGDCGAASVSRLGRDPAAVSHFDAHSLTSAAPQHPRAASRHPTAHAPFHDQAVRFQIFVYPPRPPAANRTGVSSRTAGQVPTSRRGRWVMGESNASRLRGDSLTDVIFSGSSARSRFRRRRWS